MTTTEHWVVWFEKTEGEAKRLVTVEHALEEAGICTDPETVVEIGERVLTDPDAPTKLRRLAEVWEQRANGSLRPPF